MSWTPDGDPPAPSFSDDAVPSAPYSDDVVDLIPDFETGLWSLSGMAALSADHVYDGVQALRHRVALGGASHTEAVATLSLTLQAGAVYDLYVALRPDDVFFEDESNKSTLLARADDGGGSFVTLTEFDATDLVPGYQRAYCGQIVTVATTCRIRFRTDTQDVFPFAFGVSDWWLDKPELVLVQPPYNPAGVPPTTWNADE